MIKGTNLNKYFFKGKKNEIHVINDVTIELPEKGLVTIFGPSGGGKTTLLNVLSGLDKAKGSIDFYDTHFKNYRMSKWDRLRTYEVGYIFQNYLLIEALTVYDNIKMTLEMIGIKDEKMIEKRIDYCLETVGLKNYRKRRAGQLSGGQQQRVAIARALAKNPTVIIADEPTGNLDSRNTVEIMNIIKKISKDKLVLLVTHEPNITKYYADRVIEVSNGIVVSDEEKGEQGTFDFEHSSDIFLNDLPQESLDGNNVKLESYGTFEKPLNLKLVSKDGTIYLDFGDIKERIVLLDEQSDIKLHEASHKDVKKSEDSTFDYNLYFNKPEQKRFRSFIPFKRAFKLAFNQLGNFTRRRKILLLGFFISAIIIGFVISLFVFTSDDRNKYIDEQQNVVVVENTGYTADTFRQIDGFVDFLPSRLLLEYTGTQFDQDYQKGFQFNTMVTFAEVKKPTIAYGRQIENPNEMIISQRKAREMLNIPTLHARQLKMQDLIGESFKTEEGIKFTIAGIHKFSSEDTYIAKADLVKIFASAEHSDKPYAEQEKLYDEYLINISNKALRIYSNDPDKTVDGLKDKNIKGIHEYSAKLKRIKDENSAQLRTIVTVILITAGLTWLSLFFIIRSTLFFRIDEIKVYRALGVRRLEILKIFAVEVFVITLFSSFPGYLLYAYGASTIGQDANLVLITPTSFVLPLIFIFVFNIVFGTLPATLLLMKTPAAIIASAEA